MKRILLLVLMLLLLGAAAGAWIFLAPGTGFSEDKKSLYIRTDAATKGAVLDSLRTNSIIKYDWAFTLLGDRLGYWTRIKPGKYDVNKGTSLLTLIRQLRNGQQTPVRFTINKIRTKADLARMAGSRFEFDSTQMSRFLNSPDSLREFGATPQTALALVVPDSYTYFWNTTPRKVYQKMAEESQKFWTAAQKEKATAKGLTTFEAVTLASIVEEETNADAEKGNIAATYLNRIKKGMPLQADPTIKFALNDFGIKRIYEKMLFVESPYNTYRNRGLPPGPICTPSKRTVEAVLDAPETEYLYFVANPALNGTHIFAVTYDEHLRNAKAYQQMLNRRDSIKKSK